MTKKADINETINDLTGNSQSEMDRINVKSIRSLNLITFIDLQLQKASCENELKAKVIKKIKDKLDQDQEINITELTYLLTALNKGDNELSLGVLNAIKDFYQIQQESGSGGSNGNGGNRDKGNDMDATTTKNIKKLIEIFGKFSESEFPEIKD